MVDPLDVELAEVASELTDLVKEIEVEKQKKHEQKIKRDAWIAGRDAALKETTTLMKLCPHLVHALFIPAVSCLDITLTPPDEF